MRYRLTALNTLLGPTAAYRLNNITLICGSTARPHLRAEPYYRQEFKPNENYCKGNSVSANISVKDSAVVEQYVVVHGLLAVSTPADDIFYANGLCCQAASWTDFELPYYDAHVVKSLVLIISQ